MPGNLPASYAQDSVAALRYREAFRATYGPRRKRAMRQAVVVATGAFLLAAVALSDHGGSAR